MGKEEVEISFIIPAYNEEELLPNTLDCINNLLQGKIKYEVLVIDHNSTDNTVECAKKRNVSVYSCNVVTVAALRNFGAAKACSDILVFIDADVLITKKWVENINNVVASLNENSNILTGSWVGVPEKGNWIEQYWFKPLVNKGATHINSGHMIIHRKLFSDVNGFNESLETGEDYDISMRVLKCGASIDNNPDLFVVHQGYPDSILEFFNRETWHGKGDFTSPGMFLKSKVAILSMIFLFAHIVLIVTGILNVSGTIFITSLLLVFLIPFAASVTKYKKDSFVTIVVNTFLYYIYFWARCYSFVHQIFFPKGNKRER